jgi:predicted PurR-regulated permease PerM
MLIIVILPSYLFVGSLVDGVQTLGSQMLDGELDIPEPAETVKTWPLVGGKLYELWSLASLNLETALDRFDSQIAAIGKFMLSSLVDTGLGALKFILSIIIAAVLLATSVDGKRFLAKLFDKIVGQRGQEFADISVVTIKNVAKGILGVAAIQSTLAGVGFILAGVPFAGLWTLICLILSIIQIGPSLVIIPIIIYLFVTTSPLAATLWTIYLVAVMVSDNILKPIMLGKGAPVPMLVIFLGSIGGFFLNGFVGLFIGAIVLSLGYKLFIAWIAGPEEKNALINGNSA